jgi:signal transduction histidine kinase
MTLRARLTLGLLTIAVILVVPLLVAVQALGRLHNETKELRDGDFAASLVLGEMREALTDLRTTEMAVLYVRDEKSREAMAQGIQHIERLADSLDAYDLDRSAVEIRATMNTIEAGAQAEYRAAVDGRGSEAEKISAEQVTPAIGKIESVLRAAERTLRERTRGRVAETAVQAKRGSNMAIIGLALALTVAAFIAIGLTRSVSKPVHELERGMSAVADGDFHAKLAISPSRTDEFGRLAARFEDMTRQLAELDKLKAEFVSVASHELKTPINVILGYTQLLQEDLYGPLTDKQRNVADVLEKQARNLARLVKQLLDITRFEAGGGKLEVRQVELHGFLHSLEESFQVLADQRGIRFHVGVDDAVPATVHWDSDRINEVLGNLISNAFKFTERGGEVELTIVPTDNGVQMEVRDTGAGIPADQLPHVFEKFYQADNQPVSPSTPQGGSGLGLSIARTIVEAHHGTIMVESTPGVGTRFTIVLPTNVVGRRSSAAHLAMAES